ncbi:MAG TPA: cytochrome c maturation protein CcmE [Parvularculaceae bacterium]|nr:cytochrome c maturation protein CcmE [Parvularculaceae bacterium]
MKKKTRRFYLAAGIFIFAAGAVALTLNALKGSITYFYLPSDLAALEEKPTTAIRLGGLVETGSLAYGETEEDRKPHVAFAVTDGDTRINVAYVGLLPDLFREGQGVIAHGRLTDSGDFVADEVLAKHDENYMPPEVAESLHQPGPAEPAG